MKDMSIKKAAELCGGELNTSEGIDREINEIVIDSRAVKPGDMFAAFKGEKLDGHKYVSAALDMGAACCLVTEAVDGEQRPLIKVDDAEKALEKICAGFRESLDIPVIGVTGSVGKTSAKEMLSAVLSSRYNVLKTSGNLNNTLGVPLSLSRIKPEHDIAVIEMGISGFGEMSRLANMCRPDTGVFTIIGRAHIEFLHSREGVFKAKTEMLDYISKDGAVVVNGDDDLLSGLSCPQRLISFGLGGSCDVRAVDIVKEKDYTNCNIIYGDRRIPVHIPAYGEHMVYAALEGAAVGILYGLSDDEIIRGIASYKTVGSRAALIDTGRISLIDDSYNANPDSTVCGIDSLMRVPGRKVCILGDMLELGPDENKMHYEVGRYALKSGVELLLSCGELSMHTAMGAGKIARHFTTRDELIAALPEYIRDGDAVLVKASQRSGFSLISKALKEM